MTDGATTLSEVISRRTSRLAGIGRGLNVLCCLPVQVSFRQLAQFFVCALLLLENVVQDAFILAEPELLSPGRKRCVNRDFLMLDALCRGNDAASRQSRSEIIFAHRSASRMMACIEPSSCSRLPASCARSRRSR